MILEILIATCTLVCICCTVCLLYSKILRPHSQNGTCTVVLGRGAGEELEQRVRSLVWLRSCGLLCCELVLADGGLNEEGRALAVRLAGRYPGVILCSRQELIHRLQEV